MPPKTVFAACAIRTSGPSRPLNFRVSRYDITAFSEVVGVITAREVADYFGMRLSAASKALIQLQALGHYSREWSNTGGHYVYRHLSLCEPTPGVKVDVLTFIGQHPGCSSAEIQAACNIKALHSLLWQYDQRGYIFRSGSAGKFRYSLPQLKELP